MKTDKLNPKAWGQDLPRRAVSHSGLRALSASKNEGKKDHASAAEAGVDAAVKTHQQALMAAIREPGEETRAALTAARDALIEATAAFHDVRRVAARGKVDLDGDTVTVEHRPKTNRAGAGVKWGGRRASAALSQDHVSAPRAIARTARPCPSCGKEPAGERGGRCAACTKAHRLAGTRIVSKPLKPCRMCGVALTAMGGRCPACMLIYNREYKRKAKAVAS